MLEASGETDPPPGDRESVSGRFLRKLRRRESGETGKSKPNSLAAGRKMGSLEKQVGRNGVDAAR
jgi:hypothetical protein